MDVDSGYSCNVTGGGSLCSLLKHYCVFLIYSLS